MVSVLLKSYSKSSKYIGTRSNTKTNNIFHSEVIDNINNDFSLLIAAWVRVTNNNKKNMFHPYSQVSWVNFKLTWLVELERALLGLEG